MSVASLRVTGAHGSIWHRDKPKVDDQGLVFSCTFSQGEDGEAEAASQVVISCSGSTTVVGCRPGADQATSPVWALHLRNNRFNRVGKLPGRCSALSAHPTRNDVAAAGSAAGTVHVLQLQGKATQTDLLRCHRGPVHVVQYCADQMHLMSASEDVVVLWHAMVRHCTPTKVPTTE